MSNTARHTINDRLRERERTRARNRKRNKKKKDGHAVPSHACFFFHTAHTSRRPLLQRRGWEANLTKFDEAAFFANPNGFLSAFPVCTQRRNAFIMMTTPGPETNYFHYLATATDKEGRPRLKVVRFATVCADCRVKSKPWMCTHISDKVDWIGDQDEKAFLYGGNERFRAQEQLALEISTTNRVWEPYVHNLSNRDPLRETMAIRCPMFFFGDPAMGGPNRSAVVGGYFLDWQRTQTPEYFVITYLDQFNTRGHTIELSRRIAAGIYTVRQNTFFANELAVLCIENRPQGSGSTVHRDVCAVLTNVDSIYGCGPKSQPTPGVEIDNNTKAKMTKYMSSYLRNKRIQFSAHAVTCSEDALRRFECTFDDDDMQEHNMDALRTELFAQMCRWEERAINSGPEGHRTTKFFYGGKGPNGRLNDDIALSLAMALVHPVEWAMRNKRFR